METMIHKPDHAINMPPWLDPDTIAFLVSMWPLPILLGLIWVLWGFGV
jgi:hypothetical protein